MLHELRHPNIVQIFGICVMPPALTCVLEYCLFGSLFDFLHTYRVVSATQIPTVIHARPHAAVKSSSLNPFGMFNIRRNDNPDDANDSAAVQQHKIDSANLRESVFSDMFSYSTHDLLRLTDFVQRSSSVVNRRSEIGGGVATGLSGQPQNGDKLTNQLLGSNDSHNKTSRASDAARRGNSPSTANTIEIKNRPSTNTMIQVPPHYASNVHNTNIHTEALWNRVSSVLPGSFLMDFSDLCGQSTGNSRANNDNNDYRMDFSLERINSTFAKQRQSLPPLPPQLESSVDDGGGGHIDIDNALHSNRGSNVSETFRYSDAATAPALTGRTVQAAYDDDDRYTHVV
jgi:hypothetical protein